MSERKVVRIVWEVHNARGRSVNHYQYDSRETAFEALTRIGEPGDRIVKVTRFVGKGLTPDDVARAVAAETARCVRAVRDIMERRDRPLDLDASELWRVVEAIDPGYLTPKKARTLLDEGERAAASLGPRIRKMWSGSGAGGGT